uniref:Uncharacterized protein n=1 Tax=Triticum urartu TaxID=4572 RepID=A0A8R7UR86_TRIUA
MYRTTVEKRFHCNRHAESKTSLTLHAGRHEH